MNTITAAYTKNLTVPQNAQDSSEWGGSGGSWSFVDPGLDLGAAPADGAAACAAEADRRGEVAALDAPPNRRAA